MCTGKHVQNWTASWSTWQGVHGSLVRLCGRVLCTPAGAAILLGWRRLSSRGQELSDGLLERACAAALGSSAVGTLLC